MLDGLFKSRMVGSSLFERYVVRDDRQPGPDRFWTGRGWTSKISKAMRFADINRMSNAIYRLTKRHFARLYHERRYTLKVQVSVYGPGHVTQEQLESYVERALVFKLDYPAHGSGPTPDTMVLVRIPTTKLTAVVRR
jgi:hypothetical protein